MAAGISGHGSNTKLSLSSITENDKQMAREAWIQVEYNYTHISQGLFTDLFRKHPDFKVFFKDLFEEGSDNWQTPKFEKHMVQVLVPALGQIVQKIDNFEALTTMMKKIGSAHKAKNIGIKKKHVEVLKSVFMDTLKDFLGSSLLPQHEAGLNKILSTALQIFEEQLK